MAHKFNGTDVRTPTSFSWDKKDIEIGGRTTADGMDHSEVLTEKITLDYAWSDPTKEEVSAILQLINQTRYVSITYPDAESGTDITKDFKRDKRSAPFRELRVGAKLYSSLSLSFVER
jgi:hypothetical protein